MSGVNVNPFMVPSFANQSTFQQPAWLSSYGQQPLQQIHQLVQQLPQQLQQVQQLQYLQQHQLQQLQQIVQAIPAQLAQVQHVMQAAQQVQQQPFGTAGLSALPLWSASPQAFGAQPGYLM